MKVSIRSRRQEKNLTLRAAAKLIGISHPYLIDIELGRRTPSVKIAKKIDKVLLPVEKSEK